MAETVESPHTHDPLYQRVFVGRELELNQLEQAFDAALSGNSGLAMVVGEPGIGKTALCEQLATYVAMRGGLALVGHCYEEGSLSLPYLAFVEAMRSYVLVREPDGLKSDLGSGAGDVARIISEVRDRIGVELSAAGDPEDDRWRLMQAVTAFLRNAATVQPLLIVLEDLHWADRGTLDMLLHISRNMQGARLIVVGTYRDVEVDRSHPLSGVLADLRRIESFKRLPLRGLTVDEVQRMISNVRGQDVSWSRAEMYHRQTEGNPLFIQELLRYLVEEGLVVREGTTYAIADPSQPESGVPEGLRDVIGKRLSRLSSECNQLLSVAAVIGRDFDLQTLRTVYPMDEEALLAAIEEATRVGVLEERSQPGRILYRFAHSFFRQTLYEEMIAPRRLRLHQGVARALESQYGSRRVEHAAELSEHFAQSTDASDLALAIEYGELAAERAMSVFAYAEAAAHLERCDLLLALGGALLPTEPLTATEKIAPEALELAENLNDERLAFRTSDLALEGLTRHGAGTIWRTQAWQEWAERGDRYAAPDTIERAKADINLARLRAGADEPEKSSELARQALTLARKLDDPAALFQVAGDVLGMGALNTVAELEQAAALAAEFAQWPRQSINARPLSRILFLASRLAIAAGDRDRFNELHAELGELATRTRDETVIVEVARGKINGAVLDGRLEDALVAADEARATAEEFGSAVAGQQFMAGAAYPALLLLGRADEALVSLSRAAQLAGVMEVSQRWRRALAFAHLEQESEAQALIDEFLARNDRRAPQLAIVLNTALILGEKEATSKLAPLLAPLSQAFPFVLTGEICITRLLAAAAALLGRAEEARLYYLPALEACKKARHRPEIALTRLGLAELLLEHYPDERTDAIDHLDFAIREFREMKMQPSLERALRHRELLKA